MRRHGNHHNRMLGKKRKLQLLGREGELRKTHLRSRVKSSSLVLAPRGKNFLRQITIVSNEAEKVNVSEGAV